MSKKAKLAKLTSLSLMLSVIRDEVKALEMSKLLAEVDILMSEMKAHKKLLGEPS